MSTSTPAATRRQRKMNAAEKLAALKDILHKTPIEAYRLQQQHLPGSRLTRDTWHSLPREDQEIWDMLSDSTKAAI